MCTYGNRERGQRQGRQPGKRGAAPRKHNHTKHTLSHTSETQGAASLTALSLTLTVNRKGEAPPKPQSLSRDREQNTSGNPRLGRVRERRAKNAHGTSKRCPAFCCTARRNTGETRPDKKRREGDRNAGQNAKRKEDELRNVRSAQSTCIHKAKVNQDAKSEAAAHVPQKQHQRTSACRRTVKAPS